MNKDYKYLFGPVPSRRLGHSLGVDLVPFKICSFDCVFCQLGRTPKTTVKRMEYVPVNQVIDELDHWIKEDGVADYITLSGSGEPTLNSGFGRVIEFARNSTNIPVALLTNGSLISDPEVRMQASQANVVKLSLSGWDSGSFEYINRPHHDLNMKQIIDGASLFREMFSGELWLEVFIVWGVNSIPKDVAKIAEIIEKINPDRIQLNTAVRPPAEEFVQAAPKEHLEKLAKLFNPVAEVIAEFSSEHSVNVKANEQTIRTMLDRRPCTSDQIAEVFGMHRNEVSKYIGKLLRTGEIQSEPKDGKTYYVAKRIAR